MSVRLPLINGVRYDWSSVDIKLNTISKFGIKSLDYNDSLEPGKLWGTGAQKIGRTRGQYDAEGSLELYRAESDEFSADLMSKNPNTGLYEISFPIDIYFASEGGLAPIADNLVGCRIKKRGNGGSAGNEATTVKYDLDIMYIVSGGKAPITNLKR